MPSWCQAAVASGGCWKSLKKAAAMRRRRCLSFLYKTQRCSVAPRGAENTVWLVGEGGLRGSCVVQYWLNHQKTQSFVGGGRESSAFILFHLALEGASCLS